MAETFSINPLTDWFEAHGNHFCDSVHGLYRYNGSNFLWLYPSVHDWRTWQSFAPTARNLGQHQNEEALRAAAEADNVHRLSKYISVSAQNAEQAAEIERLTARAEAAEARCAELEKALEPFAEIVERETRADETDSTKMPVAIGLLRRARAALGAKP